MTYQPIFETCVVALFLSFPHFEDTHPNMIGHYRSPQSLQWHGRQRLHARESLSKDVRIEAMRCLVNLEVDDQLTCVSRVCECLLRMANSGGLMSIFKDILVILQLSWPIGTRKRLTTATSYMKLCRWMPYSAYSLIPLNDSRAAVCLEFGICWSQSQSHPFLKTDPANILPEVLPEGLLQSSWIYSFLGPISTTAGGWVSNISRWRLKMLLR